MAPRDSNLYHPRSRESGTPQKFMASTTDLLRGELERLFELDEMTTLSSELMGYPTSEVGETNGKGAFARALVEKAERDAALEALADAIRLYGKRSSSLAQIFDVRVGDELEPGSELAGFRILKKVGDGGLGKVYLGERGEGDERVRAAIKVIRSSLAQDRSAVRRYLTGQRAFKRADVAGVADILDCGILDDGRPWVATEFVDGQTLEARVQRVGPMHFNEARPIFTAILEALHALHEHGLMHGDVKASNVFICRPNRDDGSRGEPTGVLVDGGAAKLLAAGASKPDAIGALRTFGRAEAIAPEMARGESISPTSDVYVVGVLLYHVLSGRLPFEGSSAFDIIAQHIERAPEPPSALAPKGWVSKEVDALVLKALAKAPADRYGSAGELRKAIEQLARAAEKKEDLDEKAFDAAADLVRGAPADAEAASELETVVGKAGEWQKAIEVYEEALGKVDADDDKKALLFRIARIQEAELDERQAAAATYERLREIDPDDAIALSGLEELKRQAGDHEGLAELLLERVERVESTSERAGVLREIAELYEDRLEDPDNALVAWTQALTDEPSDEKTARAIERLCGADPNRWNEVLATLSEAVQDPDSQSEATQLYVLMGRWYADQLKRPDFAIPCYAQAIQLDPSNDAAYEGTIELYERAQSWQEYVQVLEARAAATSNPASARDFRADAAHIVLHKLGDKDRAVTLFREVLETDPTHPKALDALATIHEQNGDWTALAELLAERVKQTAGPRKVQAQVQLGELYEDRLDDLEKASVQYEAALAQDESQLDALKGLERIYARQGNHQELLQVLERELEVLPTPRQKIAVLERIGAIQEEEFVSPEKAIEAYEQVVAIDPGHEHASPALARLYRQVSRFDDLVEVLEQHARATTDDGRKVDLLVQAARTLMRDVGSPERAIEICDRVLDIEPGNVEALGLQARLKAQLGDATAAVEAVDKLAASESDPAKKAAHYVEAGKLLEESGDKDRAIQRYKLALDADETNTEAAAALRSVYGSRGDASGAADLLLREIAQASGSLQQAKLQAELGHLYAERLEDPRRALDAFTKALELDPTCTPAARGLGDMAFAQGDYAKAAELYEPLLSRTTEMEDDVARAVCVRTGEAFLALEQFGKAERAFLNAKAYAPDDREVLEKLADVTFAGGDALGAAELYRELIEKSGDQIAVPEKGRMLYRRGEALRRAGEKKKAMVFLEEAAELRPDDAAPLMAIKTIHADDGDWDRVVSVLRRRMENAGDEERYELLVEAGDVLQQKLNDRSKAAKSYVAALEITPDDRNLLTKLMGVYSETRDWSRLIEVILRIAELVDDKKQLAKYYQTAGSIARTELKRLDEAADYFEQALENDPRSKKAFEGLVTCLEQGESWSELAKAYRARLAYLKDAGASAEDRAALWDKLGDLYRDKLEDLREATDAYEEAQELAPDARARLEMLAEIYEADPKRFLPKAVDVHAQLLRKSPYRVESYQALRQLYTDVKKADQSWCVCQTLKVLNMADPDERAFYKKHRSSHPAAAEEFFSEDIWFNHLVHPSQDPLLTQIFAAIAPAVIADRAQPLSSYEVDAKPRDPASDDAAMIQTLGYVGSVAQIELPPVYARPSDAGGLSFLVSDPPAIGAGKGALAGGPPQALAFVAARHLAYFRGGHLVRHLVPSGSGLRAWLLAAIKLATPQFPVPAKMASKVDDSLRAIETHVAAGAKDRLRGLVNKLLAAAPELDMKKWIAAVDLTADRVGFVMANDLEMAIAVIKASAPEAVAQKERLKELYLYSVSQAYLDLRQRVGIAIDG